MTTHEIWLDDQYGRRLAFLETLIGFDVVKVANEVSVCMVTVPSTFDISLLRVDNLIEFWRTPTDGSPRLENIFFLRHISYEEDTSGNDVVVLGGPDANDLLARRIVYYAAGTAQAETGGGVKAEISIKGIVRENLGSSATAVRDLSALNFTVAANQDGGEIAVKSFAWRNVLLVIQDLARMSAEKGTELFFEVIPVEISAMQMGFEFQTSINQPGEDRTYTTLNPIIFGKEWGNLVDGKLTYDYMKEANVVIAGGQGDGEEREIIERTDSQRVGASIWNYREKFADARNEPTTAGVTDKADEVLRASAPITKFTGRLLDTKQTRYGVDWFFGDKVVITHGGIQFDGIVKAVRLRLRKDGEEDLKVKVEVVL